MFFSWTEVFEWFWNEIHVFGRPFILCTFCRDGVFNSHLHMVDKESQWRYHNQPRLHKTWTCKGSTSQFESCRSSDSFNLNAVLKIFNIFSCWLPGPFLVCLLFWRPLCCSGIFFNSSTEDVVFFSALKCSNGLQMKSMFLEDLSFVNFFVML